MKKMALAGTSVLAIGMSGAVAQTVTNYTYNFGGAPSTFEIAEGNYLLRIENDEQLTGNIQAMIIAEIAASGDNQNVSLVTSQNSMQATAIGNHGLALIEDDTNSSEDWGLRILSSQIALDNTVVSTIEDSTIGQTVPAGVDVSHSVEENTIAASTTVNTMTNALTAMPSDQTAPEAGSVSGGYAGGTVSVRIEDAHSSISNNQFIVNSGTLSGSNSTVTGSNILVDSTSADPLGGEVASEKNSISASYMGNEALNSISEPESVEHVGSAIIANVQVATETPGTGEYSALVGDSSITIDLAVPSFTGTTSLSDNSIAADSTGNAATNQIVFGENVSVAGANGLVNAVHFDSGTQFDGELAEADYGIASVQANLNTLLASKVDGSDITAVLSGTVMGAEIAVDGNSIEAAATGNSSGNLIAADGPDVAASFGISGHQINDNTPVTAEVANATIGAAMQGPLAGVEDSSTVSVAGNSMGAEATGNNAASTISLNAVDLDFGPAGMGSADADPTGPGTFGYAVALGGATITNVQSNYGTGAVSASVTDSAIGMEVIGDAISSNAAVEFNSVEAVASGNVGSTRINLSGTNGTGSAAVVNTQVNAVPVTASLSGIDIAMTLVSLDGGALSVSDNEMSAIATGNSGRNIINASGFTTLTLGANNVDYDGGIQADWHADAALAIVSNQDFRADVEATIGGQSQIVIGNVASIMDGVAAINDNEMLASATGNEAVNGLLIEATSLQPGNAGQADLFGAVVNLQTSTEGSNVSATIMGHEIGLGMGATTASTLSVSGNASKAEALGNDATNELILAGTSHAAANTLDAGDVGYSFMLVNTQILAADSGILASVSDQRIGVSGDAVGSSTVDIFGNSQVAEARGNRAANTVSFGFSLLGEEGRIGDLQTSASLENSQNSAAEITATVSLSEIGAEIGSVDETTLGVAGNLLSALAIGNQATNGMSVETVSLTGNATETMEIDFLVSSGQINTGSVGAGVDTSIVGIVSTTITDSTSNVSDNSVQALAIGNSAGNSLSIEAVTATANGLVSNVQSNDDAAVSASVGGLQIGLGTSNSLVATDSVSSVLNNLVGAQAAGNSSTNSLTLAAVTSNGTGYVSNDQANSGPILATVLSAQIGMGSSATPATVTGGVGAVLNNGVSARSFGNSSDNRLNIASVSSNVVGGISNMQVNSGAVTSRVTGVSVGIWTGVGSQIGSTVTGNSITAAATGNSTVNVVRRTNY